MNSQACFAWVLGLDSDVMGGMNRISKDDKSRIQTKVCRRWQWNICTYWNLYKRVCYSHGYCFPSDTRQNMSKYMMWRSNSQISIVLKKTEKVSAGNSEACFSVLTYITVLEIARGLWKVMIPRTKTPYPDAWTWHVLKKYHKLLPFFSNFPSGDIPPRVDLGWFS